MEAVEKAVRLKEEAKRRETQQMLRVVAKDFCFACRILSERYVNKEKHGKYSRQHLK